MTKGGQRDGSALKTAVVVTGGLVLAWITVEAAFKPFLDGLRAAVSRSTNPSRDPDEEPTATPVADEDKAPAPAVAEDKEPAFAPAEPSAPPLPAEEELESEKKKGEDKEVELEEKGEGAVAAKAE